MNAKIGLWTLLGAASLLGACATHTTRSSPMMAMGNAGSSDALVFPSAVVSDENLAERNGESQRRDCALASRDYSRSTVTDYYPPEAMPDARYARYLYIPSNANTVLYYEQRTQRETAYSTPWWR